MAVVLDRQPFDVVFSRNPVVFEFSTTNQMEKIGRPFRASLKFANGQLENTGMTLKWGTVEFDYTFKDAPDDSGLELPAIGSESLSEWVDRVIVALQQHYYLAMDFSIRKSGTDTIVFQSYEHRADRTMLFLNNGMQGVTYLVNQSAIEALVRKNYALYLELWVQDEGANSGRVYTSSVVEFDERGKAFWDVQQQLTAIIQNGGLILPGNTVVADSRSVRRFFIRYAEMYDQPQRVKRMEQSKEYVVCLGGKEDMYNGSLKDIFFNGLNKWMVVGKQYIHRKQPFFASLINFDKDYNTVVVKCLVVAKDGSEIKYDLFRISNWKLYTKLVVPAGVENAVKNVADVNGVIGLLIWLEAGGRAISTLLEIQVEVQQMPALQSLVFVNSYGSFTSLYTYGKRTFGYDLEKTGDAFAIDGNKIEYKELGIRSRDVVRINSGFFSLDRLKRFRDFILSRHKYLIIDGRLEPVVLDSSSIEEHSDFSNMKSVSFNLKYATEQTLWNS